MSRSTARASWRLLLDGDADGPHNMAVDEALLEAYDAADAAAGPTLRLYGWSSPTISLGRTQRAADGGAAWLSAGVDLVRRPTGGDAVLHGVERTYAVAGRLGAGPFPSSVGGTYAAIAEALTAALRTLGIAAETAAGARGAPRRRGGTAWCHERAGLHEIVAGGFKLVGSAQARRRRAFLQHGSLPFRVRREAIAAAGGAGPVGWIGIDEAAGREIAPSELDAALVAAFARRFRAALEPGRLAPEEAERAAALRAWRYDSMAWTIEGRVGARERAWGPPFPA